MRTSPVLSAVALASSVPLRVTPAASATVTAAAFGFPRRCCSNIGPHMSTATSTGNRGLTCCYWTKFTATHSAKAFALSRLAGSGHSVSTRKSRTRQFSLSGAALSSRGLPKPSRTYHGGVVPTVTSRRHRGLALYMASVTEREIMSEFASAAAAEEHASNKTGRIQKSLLSVEDPSERKAGIRAEAANHTAISDSQHTVDKSRPTGYR